MLERNLKYLRKQKSVSQKEAATAIGISRTTLADYENGRSEPTASVLNELAKYYGENVHDLLNRDIDTPLFNRSTSELKSLQNREVRVLTVTVQENQRQNIEYVPVAAIAGYAQNISNPEYVKELAHFTLPKLSQGIFRAFEIRGNSMPPIDDDFVVVGKYVEHFSDLKNGKRYVFVLKGDGIVFKRVINEVEINRRLILVSDNPEYLPYTVNIEEVIEAWEMVSFIGYPNKKVDISQAILDKLHLIEQKITHLSPK